MLRFGHYGVAQEIGSFVALLYTAYERKKIRLIIRLWTLVYLLNYALIIYQHSLIIIVAPLNQLFCANLLWYVFW